MNKLSSFIVTSAVVVGGYLAYDNIEVWLNAQDAPPAVAVSQEPVSVVAEVVPAVMPPSASQPPKSTEQAVAPVAKPSNKVNPNLVVLNDHSEAARVVPTNAPALTESSPTKVATEVVPTPRISVTLPIPKAAVAPEPAPMVEKPKETPLTIKEIKFTGVTLFPEKTLTATVAEFIGKELTVEEAFAIPAKIANHYKGQNQMAIATLVGAISPNGVLTVGVVEMPMTQTQAEKALSTMVSPTTPASAVMPISVPNVTSAMTPASAPAPTTAGPITAPTSMPTAVANPATSVPPPQLVSKAPAPPSVAVSQTASKELTKATAQDVDSETEYILKQYAKKSRQYEIMVDNYGPSATGTARVGASLKMGEQFSLLGFKAQGSDYLRMAYRWVTGVEGLSIGVHASQLNYEVVNNLQTALYKSGDAVKRGVELVYDLVNETSQISTLALKFDNKSSSAIGLNLANSAAYTSWVSGLELKGLFREMMPGGAVFTYNAQVAYGNVDSTGATSIGGIDVDEGVFSKIRFNGTLMQPLGGLGSLFAGLTVQRSNRNLDPSERFYLGGPLGVRAYGMGEGAGSEGELATLEFRQRLSSSTTLAEFYDWGRVRLTQEATTSSTLSGVGVSLSQDMGNGVTLKGTWARSTGNQSPLPNPTHNDDKVDRNRFWLSMEARF